MRGLRPITDPVASAAQWFVRRQGGDARAREQGAFERWTEADPANADAFAEMEALWAEIGDCAVEDPIMAMRREALTAAPPRSDRRWLPYAAAAAVLFALVTSIAIMRPFAPDAPATQQVASAPVEGPDVEEFVYRTQVGERSVARLPDGSTAQLNTNTVIRVAYAPDERRIDLLRGEALFDVAHNPERPFVVDAGDERVVALGTSFTVRREVESVAVTLLEGKVAVEKTSEALGKGRLATLAPGQQLIASPKADLQIRKVDLNKVTSWRGGFISFDGEPLAKVVEEINRYTVRKIEIADPSLGALPVSGVFKTGSTDSIVAALQMSFPVERVRSARDDRIVLDWAEGAKP